MCREVPRVLAARNADAEELKAGGDRRNDREVSREHGRSSVAIEQTAVMAHLHPRAGDTDGPPLIEPQRRQTLQSQQPGSKYDQEQAARHHEMYFRFGELQHTRYPVKPIGLERSHAPQASLEAFTP